MGKPKGSGKGSVGLTQDTKAPTETCSDDEADFNFGKGFTKGFGKGNSQPRDDDEADFNFGKGFTKGFGKGNSQPRDDDDSDSEDDCESDSEVGQGQLFGDLAEQECGDDDDICDEFFSPFGIETFSSASKCWSQAEVVHGFSIRKLREAVGSEWSDYHRIRFVNYLRKLGPEQAAKRARTLNFDDLSNIWTDDSLLVPVLESDPLLFEDEVDDEVFSDSQNLATGSACVSNTVAFNGHNETAEQQVVRLEAALTSARNLLSKAFSDDWTYQNDIDGGSSGSRTGITKQRDLNTFDSRSTWAMMKDPSLAESFRAMLSNNKATLRGGVALNVACGAGFLSCLAAREGISRVVSLEASHAALDVASRLATANGCADKVSLIQGCGSSSTSPSYACDVVFSERLISDLRYSPYLMDLLAAREKHLRAGGLILPQRTALFVEGVDWHCGAANLEPPVPFADFDLSALCQPNCIRLNPPELSATLPADKVVTIDACAIFNVDLATADFKDVLPADFEFVLKLRPGGCMSALALKLEAPIGDAKATESDRREHCGPYTILPLRQSDGQPMRVNGNDTPEIRGSLRTSMVEGSIRISVALSATGSTLAKGATPARCEMEFLVSCEP